MNAQQQVQRCSQSSGNPDGGNPDPMKTMKTRAAAGGQEAAAAQVTFDV
jgi:hypothetical protein